jgi:hypothetical protein
MKECTRCIQNKSLLGALHEAMLTYSCEYRRMDALNQEQILQEKLTDCNGSISDSDFNSIACGLKERICEANRSNGLADDVVSRHCFDRIRVEQNLYLFRARVAQVRNEDGTILQTPEDIAAAVHTYWTHLYKKSSADVSAMDAYIKSINAKVGKRLLPQFTHIDEELIRFIIRQAKGSTPGPDGIRISVIQQLEHFYAPILHGILKILMERDTLPPSFDQFNMGTLFCIPKKTSSRALGDLRGITVANFSNRIISGAIRISMQQSVESTIGNEQYAFISRRTMTQAIARVLNRYYGDLQLGAC